MEEQEDNLEKIYQKLNEEEDTILQKWNEFHCINNLLAREDHVLDYIIILVSLGAITQSA